MKNRQHQSSTLLFILLAFANFSFSQAPLTKELKFEVNQVYPYISITKEKLNRAKTLTDLNKRYQASWVKEYKSVEILATYQGKTKKITGKNNVLNQAQIELMKGADAGTAISVKVLYLPENNLKDNDNKELKFSFYINPESEAKYIGGQPQLKQYLKEKAIDKIATASFQGYNLAAVKFTIDEKGQIINAHVFETSKDEKVDALLLKAIRNMPSWQPAAYSNGTKVKQEFVLTVGNHESCVMHLLNIR